MSPLPSIPKALALAAFGTWAVYLVAANVYLQSGTHRAIVNQRPERLELLTQGLWSPLPGLVLIDGLDLRTQSDTLQMNITSEEASIWLNPFGLGRQSLHILRARGEGVTVKVLSRLEEGAEASTASPTIRGLSNPPDPDPEVLYGPPDAMTIRLDNVHLEDVQELWINTAHYRGGGSLAGALAATPRASIASDSIDWILEEGTLSLNDAVAATDLQGEIRLTLDPFDLKAGTLDGLFRGLSGTVAVEGTIANPRFLNYYLRGIPWFSLDGGEGPISAALSLKGGELQGGSRLSITPEEVQAHLAGFDIQGPGDVRFAVDDASPPMGRLDVSMGAYTIGNALAEGDWVVGEGITLMAESPSLFLPEGFVPLNLSLTLPPAQASDLRVFNAYLPRHLGIGLGGGEGELQGTFTGSTADQIGKGTLSLNGEGVLVRVDQLSILGNAQLDLKVIAPNINEGRLQIGGSVLDLRGIRLKDETTPTLPTSELWWGHVAIDGGEIAVGAPVFLEAYGKAKLKDTKPLVTAFASQKDLPRWSHGLLTKEEIDANFAFALRDDLFILDPLSVEGADFAVDARLRRDGLVNKGAMLLETRGLSVGVGIQNGRRNIALRKAEAWYQGRPILGSTP